MNNHNAANDSAVDDSAMDHSAMDHSAMDHSAMDHSAMDDNAMDDMAAASSMEQPPESDADNATPPNPGEDEPSGVDDELTPSHVDPDLDLDAQ